MPKRITTYRVDSAEVQGEGSWVEMSYITYGERLKALKGGSKTFANDILNEHILAWNWVDSDGKPFGDPQDCLVDLFPPEREFLIGKLFNPKSEAAEKN